MKTTFAIINSVSQVYNLKPHTVVKYINELIKHDIGLKLEYDTYLDELVVDDKELQIRHNTTLQELIKHVAEDLQEEENKS